DASPGARRSGSPGGRRGGGERGPRARPDDGCGTAGARAGGGRGASADAERVGGEAAAGATAAPCRPASVCVARAQARGFSRRPVRNTEVTSGPSLRTLVKCFEPDG